VTQLQLNFEPGLTAQFKTLEDCLATCVYGSRQGLQGAASEADQSPSEMSRRLNKTDALPLRVSDMIAALDATRDLRPIYWLIERYIQDPEAMKALAAQQIVTLLPQLLALAEQATGGKIKAVK
jgi:hypothetical protein